LLDGPRTSPRWFANRREFSDDLFLSAGSGTRTSASVVALDQPVIVEEVTVPRLRQFMLLAVAAGLLGFSIVGVAQDEKKDAPKDDVKKEEVKKDEPKKVEEKKDEAKKDEAKKDEAKKDEPKKEDPKKAEPAALAWKFTVNTPFFQKMTTSTEQKIKVMGLDVVQKQDQTFYFEWTPTKQDGDKWTITQKIQGIQMKIDIAGNPVSFDSTQESNAGGANVALAEFFKALKDASFTLVYNTTTQKVESVSGKDDFLKKLATANSQLEPLLKKILSDEALKQMADPTFGFLPPTNKKPEESWDSTSTLNLGPIGVYTTKYTFTYKGEDKANKDLDVINFDTKLSYAAPAEPDASLPFKIKSADLKTEEKLEPGKILFNKKLGRLEKSNVKLIVVGKLTIEIGGNSTQVDLNQTQTIDVETADKSLVPVADPKKQ
jgi:hypothetical protein